MVFDVESIGLHGEGFAVGFVIVNSYGVEVQHGLVACHPDRAVGTLSSREWVKANVPPLGLTSVSACSSPREVRNHFWHQWESWKDRGAILFADCCWPVEARFLAQCVDDNPEKREWSGPYPLHDIASVIFASGGDPSAKYGRLENELPEHNPLCDARQSARILIEALNIANPSRAQRDKNRLWGALAGLVGASTREELEGLKSVMPPPDESTRTVADIAIETLLETMPK